MTDPDMPLIYSELDTQQFPLIYKKISLVMGEVSPIAKDKVAMGYKFRGIDDLYQALQHVLSKHGVFTVPEVLEERSEERTTSKGSLLIYRILKIKYTFYAEDGSSVQAIVIGEGMDSGDKATNKAMSVAQKYALLQVFCIPTAEPKDPEIDSHEVTPKADPWKTILAAGEKNGWSCYTIDQYILEKFSKNSVHSLTRDEQIQLYKVVCAYGPTQL